MGMASTTTKLWTVAEVRALPEDGRRYEVIDGVLLVNGVEVPGGDLAAFADVVTPAPSWLHGDAVEAMYLRLHGYLASARIGVARLAPRDVELGPDAVVQPDLFVIPLVDGHRPRSWEEVGRLLLAVEVVSPSSARDDRVRKRRLYQRAGVPEYWIVDVDARLVERWRPEDERPEVLDETLTWQPDAGQPPLVIDLVAYFAEVWAE
jgi:Uma2 family endonuclease